MLLPPSALEVYRVTDPDSVRWALSAVRVERPAKKGSEPVTVATNGRVIVALTWDEDDPAEYPGGVVDAASRPGFVAMIDRKDAKKAQTLPPKRSSKPILLNVALDESEGQGGHVAVGATDLETPTILNPRQVEGRFPKWREYVPHDATPDNSVSVKLDAKLLIPLLQAIAKHCTEDEKALVTLTLQMNPESGGPLASQAKRNVVLFTAETYEGNKAAGVINSVYDTKRDKPEEPLMPGWLPAEKATLHEPEFGEPAKKGFGIEQKKGELKC